MWPFKKRSPQVDFPVDNSDVTATIAATQANIDATRERLETVKSQWPTVNSMVAAAIEAREHDRFGDELVTAFTRRGRHGTAGPAQ